MKSSAFLPIILIVASCATSGRNSGDNSPLQVDTDLPISSAPFEHLEANWKQRLDQPYVYIELHGSYTQIGKTLETVDRALTDQGLEPSGPPFALYYDDPAKVPTEQLRARACFPVAARVKTSAPLAYDLLPGTTVVYAFVGGAYPEVPRAYPGLYAYLDRMHWREAGPIREVYLINPATVKSFDELVTEVQIPASASN